MLLKGLKYIGLGFVLGIIFTKSEIISWFRIYEMFQFDSFHMYGIIGSAIAVGALGTYMIKKNDVHDQNGQAITIADKSGSPKRYIYGGLIFGFGWALSGSCPGPMFFILGTGASFMLITIVFAILGTLTYGLLRDKLPH